MRRELEQGLMERGGPVLLPHKGYSDIRRQRAFIRFQTGVCARLKRAEKRQRCQQRVKEMRGRLKDLVVWYRDRCKRMTDARERRECLRKLVEG
jgi:hypothetical protein